jgi:hypothetical protein
LIEPEMRAELPPASVIIKMGNGVNSLIKYAAFKFIASLLKMISALTRSDERP